MPLEELVKQTQVFFKTISPVGTSSFTLFVHRKQHDNQELPSSVAILKRE